MDILSIERRIAPALLATLALAAAPALAQTPPPPPLPPGTQPLEDLPPPPPMITGQPEPQVTTRTDGENTIEEYRVNGKLYMQRITPKHGKPYILMDLKGDGTFTRQDNTVDGNLSVPQWVLLTF